MQKSWTEVPANGIYRLQLQNHSEFRIDMVTCYPYLYSSGCDKLQNTDTSVSTKEFFQPIADRVSHICNDVEIVYSDQCFQLPFSKLCDELPSDASLPCTSQFQFDETKELTINREDAAGDATAQANCSEALMSLMTSDQDRLSDELLNVLGESVKVRVERQSHLCHNCIARSLNRRSHEDTVSGDNTIPSIDVNGVSAKPTTIPGNGERCGHARIGVLYSGGIDSLVIAALADRYLYGF